MRALRRAAGGRWVAVGLVVGAVVVGLGGCTQELPDFSAAQVVDAVTSEVTRSSGTTPSDVECGTLEPEVDAQTDCSYVLVDRSQESSVTVTSVQEEDVEFAIETTSTYLDPDQLTALVSEQLDAGGATGELTCLDPLELDEGTRAYCALVDGDTTSNLAITAQSGAE